MPLSKTAEGPGTGTVEEKLAALREAFVTYRADIDKSEAKRRPTDGLLGFGRSLKDDACHDRLDERIQTLVSEICELSPDTAQAEKAVLLLLRDDVPTWPLAAQWMLQATERHALSLIPFLSQDTALVLYTAYTRRYRPWDRLPAQKEIVQALRKQARVK